jgi:hypothetical protein
MKKIITAKFFIAIYLVLNCISACHKEMKCENCNTRITDTNNKPPVANAGPDKEFFLPADSIILDGFFSFDPDGIIKSFFWSKIAGPASFSILQQNAAQTKVINLIQGDYKFELTVTDSGGLKARDTVSISIYPAPPGKKIIFFSYPSRTIKSSTITIESSNDTVVLYIVKISDYPH